MSQRHLARYLTRELHFLGYFPSDDFIDMVSEVIVYFIEESDEFNLDELANYIHTSMVDNGFAPLVVLIDDISDLTMKYIEDNEIMEVDWQVDVEMEKD